MFNYKCISSSAVLAFRCLRKMRHNFEIRLRGRIKVDAEAIAHQERIWLAYCDMIVLTDWSYLTVRAMLACVLLFAYFSIALVSTSLFREMLITVFSTVIGSSILFLFLLAIFVILIIFVVIYIKWLWCMSIFAHYYVFLVYSRDMFNYLVTMCPDWRNINSRGIVLACG